MATVSELSDRYISQISRLDPPRGDRWGVAADQTRLSDFSPAGFAVLEEVLAGLARELSAAVPVDEAERLGKGFLQDQVDGELGLLRTGERERWLSNITGPASYTRAVFDNMDLG